MRTRKKALLTVAGMVALSAAASMSPPVASADIPHHAKIVCDSATWYENYDHASGPHPPGGLYTVYRGDKVGHTRGAHPVYNGWASTFDFGGPRDNDWGFVRYECLGEWGSW